MFEIARLAGTGERGIEVQTRLGTSVKNAQAPEPDERSKNIYHRLCKRHDRWVERKPPCGIYNCFGHIWASRRTSIYDEDQVHLIIHEDGYRIVESIDKVKPGDTVLYSTRENNSILHMGEITEIRRIELPKSDLHASPGAPWILSKWNDAMGEVYHHYQDIPWAEGDLNIRFLTDRPEESK